MSVEKEGARYLCASLERLLTHPKGFALVSATPLQRAICRIADGEPLDALGADDTVRSALGVEVIDRLEKPKELALIAGIRGGKSLLTAAMGVKASQTCDVSLLGPGEVPRVSILSTKKDLADVVFQHVVGRVLASPFLKHLLVKPPTGDTVTLEHPSGRPVEICVVAGSRAGASVVGRWMAAVIFDEFARMYGQDEGVINWDESRRAVLGRILPGGYLAHVGSPWAPFGPAYDLVTNHHGRPSPDLVVIRARGDQLNPIYWTSERLSDFRRREPDAFLTDVLAEFASPEESLFNGLELDRATRASPVEVGPEYGHNYIAATDPATRSNGWTLVLLTKGQHKKRVVCAREWRGSKAEPLSPKAVLQEIAQVLKPYNITTLLTDQYYSDALRDLARDVGLNLHSVHLSEKEKTERYINLKHEVATGNVELSPDPTFRADLQRIKRTTTQSGVTMKLPHTSDGRHCDYAAALMLAFGQALLEPVRRLSQNEAIQQELEDAERRAERMFSQRR